MTKVIQDGPKSYHSELELSDMLEKLDDLQEQIYQAHREFTPMYPLVLVLMLRKQQVRKSGVILADHQQNKPMHEGIVLATWAPKVMERGTINKNGERLTRCEVLHSELSAGDHVLFHHWAGMPIHGFDDQRFRVLRERDWHETQQGGIVGVLHYSERSSEPLEAIVSAIKFQASPESLDFESLPLIMAKLRDRYVVIDKEAQAVTLSGA